MDFLTPTASRLQPVYGGVAQLVEHLVCIQRVIGSSPFTSTEALKNACFLREKLNFERIQFLALRDEAKSR